MRGSSVMACGNRSLPIIQFPERLVDGGYGHLVEMPLVRPSRMYIEIYKAPSNPLYLIARLYTLEIPYYSHVRRDVMEI